MENYNMWIGGIALPIPAGFAVEKTDCYINEYTTVTGKTIADYQGWKYANMTLNWEALPEELVLELAKLPPSFWIVFPSMESDETTEWVKKVATVGKKHRFTASGKKYWKDVSLSIEFLNVHKE